MSTIDEKFLGKFLDATWGSESETMMMDLQEALEGINEDGRTRKFELSMTFKKDGETNLITPILQFGVTAKKRQKTAASFSLRDSGQLDFTAYEKEQAGADLTNPEEGEDFEGEEESTAVVDAFIGKEQAKHLTKAG